MSTSFSPWILRGFFTEEKHLSLTPPFLHTSLAVLIPCRGVLHIFLHFHGSEYFCPLFWSEQGRKVRQICSSELNTECLNTEHWIYLLNAFQEYGEWEDKHSLYRASFPLCVCFVYLFVFLLWIFFYFFWFIFCILLFMNTALRMGALCWELIYRLRPTLDARKQTVLLQCKKKKSILRRQRLEIWGTSVV